MAARAMTPYQRHRDAIAALLDPRCYTIDWLDGQIERGDMIAFGNDAAAIVVAVKQYPAGATELHGMVAAGDLAVILKLIVKAEHWAIERGITFACIASRSGWSKVLLRHGYSVYQTVLRKDLSDGPE